MKTSNKETEESEQSQEINRMTTSSFFISINNKNEAMNKINGIYIYIYISKVHYGTKI